MKNKLFFFLMAACLLAACRQKVNYLQVIENDWKKDGLRGRVRKVVTTRYRRENIGWQKVEEYDEKGFKRHGVMIDPGFTAPNDVYAYRYDTVNSTTYEIRYEANGDKHEDAYEYDADGNLRVHAMSKLIKGDREAYFTGKRMYKYDGNNRMLQEKTYWREGKLAGKKEWKYNDDDSSTLYTYYEGEEGWKKDAELISAHVDSLVTWNPDGKVIYRSVNKKDKACNCWYEEEWDNGKTLQRTHYYSKYDDRVMTVTFNKERNTYDTARTPYLYDDKGNWLQSDSTLRREIFYW